jgi:hypothetical protein
MNFKLSDEKHRLLHSAIIVKKTKEKNLRQEWNEKNNNPRKNILKTGFVLKHFNKYSLTFLAPQKI